MRKIVIVFIFLVVSALPTFVLAQPVEIVMYLTIQNDFAELIVTTYQEKIEALQAAGVDFSNQPVILDEVNLGGVTVNATVSGNLSGDLIISVF